MKSDSKVDRLIENQAEVWTKNIEEDAIEKILENFELWTLLGMIFYSNLKKCALRKLEERT